MNIPLLIAGILTTIIAVGHSIREVTTIRALASADLKEVPKLELRAAFPIHPHPDKTHHWTSKLNKPST